MNTGNDDILDGGVGIDTMLGGSGDDIYFVDGKYRQFPEKEQEDEQHRKHGKGNEGLGNGYDTPPPGHDDNWNDYRGTSPGHPGSREDHRHREDHGSSHHRSQAGHEQDQHDRYRSEHQSDSAESHDRQQHSNSNDDEFDKHSRSEKRRLQLITDTVIENADQGYDIVYSSVDYTLTANVEELHLTDTARKGNGNDLDNALYGNQQRNRLMGAAGADRLYGGAGNDRLYGGAGDDQLQGGSGRDRLLGGSGDDVYLFSRGDSQDRIIENDDMPDNHDILRFLQDIDHDQLWFSRHGKDIRIDVIGTSDRVSIAGWYKGPGHQVEEIQAADGLSLANGQIDQLAAAMASFNPPVAGELTLSSEQQEQLAPVLAAAWA